MLEHGTTEAAASLSQLEKAEVTSWRCSGGCASFNLSIRDMPEPPASVHVLGEFVFGDTSDLAGIFIFSGAGILRGVWYGLAGDAPRRLPTPEELRPRTPQSRF